MVRLKKRYHGRHCWRERHRALRDQTLLHEVCVTTMIAVVPLCIPEQEDQRFEARIFVCTPQHVHTMPLDYSPCCNWPNDIQQHDHIGSSEQRVDRYKINAFGHPIWLRSNCNGVGNMRGSVRAIFLTEQIKFVVWDMQLGGYRLGEG